MNECSFIIKGPQYMADRESRKKQLTAKQQKQITAAAMGVFVRKVYTNATISEITKSSGLAAGTIYICYPSKHELFIAVIESLMVTPVTGIFTNKVKNEFPDIIKNAVKNRISFLQGINLNWLLSLMGDIQRDTVLPIMFSEKVIKPFLIHMESLCQERVPNDSVYPVYHCTAGFCLRISFPGELNAGLFAMAGQVFTFDLCGRRHSGFNIARKRPLKYRKRNQCSGFLCY